MALPRPALLEWLCLAAGVALTLRYAWLMDDAFVYFRYVDNAVFLKLGLVYNLGEYVEGFSSPLWALLLLLLRAAGLGYWTLTRLVGVVAFSAVWYGLVVLNRRVSPPRPAIMNLPLCWLAANYGALCNFTSGLETPLVQGMAVLFALFAVSPGSRGLQAALALAPLLRHELAAAWLVAWIAVWIQQRRLPLWMAAWVVAVNGAWLAFRIVYYADLLPNTFYLKDGNNWRQGWLYLKDTVLTYWVLPVLGACAAGMLVAWRRWRARVAGGLGAAVLPAAQASTPPPSPPSRQSTAQQGFGAALQLRARLWMLLLALPVLVYVLRIGGDHRHYRYLAYPMLLLLCSGAGIAEQLVGPLAGRRARVGATLAGGLVLLAVGLAFPRQLSRHPALGRGEYRMVDNIEDAAVHRYHKDLAMPVLGGDARLEQKEQYRELRAREPQLQYRGVAISLWCVALYHDFSARAVHNLGLTDPILAHVAMKADRPAHKLGLLPLAADIAQILRAYRVGGVPQPGLYERAVREGQAPSWIAHNLDTIGLIERKEFNRHHLLENLRLAFTPVPRLRIRPEDAPVSAPGEQRGD